MIVLDSCVLNSLVLYCVGFPDVGLTVVGLSDVGFAVVGFTVVGFSDNGIEFDPTAPRGEETDFDMLDMGGMGIGIVRETASSMEYARKDDRNVLILRFRL